MRVLVVSKTIDREKIAKVRARCLPEYCERGYDFRFASELLQTDIVSFNPHVVLNEDDISGTPGEIASIINKKFSRLIIRTDGPQSLVSIFTPTYKTPTKWLERARKSVLAQSYSNTEWIIYDDTPDLSIWPELVDMTGKDPRIRAYRSTRNSGCVGETKRNACGLCRGSILLELDHDDELTTDCVKNIVAAFEKHPDSGFAYTNWAEVLNDRPRPLHPEGSGYGYAYYRKAINNGVWHDTVVSPPINSKTIRYINACPNHARAWKTDAYWKAGGHNPQLDVGDDYDLVARTFLTTRMIHVDCFGYIQHYHGQNTQNETVDEIQRVCTMAIEAYEPQIKTRFADLGVNDYALDERGNLDLTIMKESGNCTANYIFTP